VTLAGVLNGYIQWQLAGDKEFRDIKRSVMMMMMMMKSKFV